MAITYTDEYKDLILDAVAPLTETGTVKLYTAADVEIGSVTVPANHFPDASGGETLATTALDIDITTAGTATYFRIYNVDGTSYREGTVGTSGADMNFSSNVFNIGDTARIQTWRISQA